MIFDVNHGGQSVKDSLSKMARELLDKVLDLRKQKKSMGQICAMLGVTRGCIAGLLHRARKHGLLPPVDNTASRARLPAIPAATVVKQPPTEIEMPKRMAKKISANAEPVAAPPIMTVAAGICIIDLEWDQCRAVIGKQADGHRLALCCGRTRMAKSSYCEPHTREYAPGYFTAR